MNKKQFFAQLDKPDVFLIPKNPQQEKWAAQWVRRQNRIEVMNLIFGDKGSRVIKRLTIALFYMLGLFSLVLAFSTGFIIYLLAGLILWAFGYGMRGGGK